ncbi:FadR/GntR family transcriptional regulator [Pleomorphomonas koreensis]|uniref:FadR/GntR family transcriptional regulator n=1 Tax=Pleomorphomonas koreensis TaxID=257440 RepID=UPI0004091471|nr:FadR/GntR family transcriptional regulator [Pleomorphomonas koreensis]
MADGISSLERIPRVDRVRSVMNALADHIDRAGMKPGDKLPTERELSLALGVGRSTVREVIRQLQALGVAEPRVGSGTFLIRTISPATVHMPLSLDMSHLRDALLQTLEVRRGLEVEASAVAALRHTPEDVPAMEAALIEMERVHIDKGTAGREDLAFHLSIYDSTHNPLFSRLIEQMREAFESFFEQPFDRPDFARRSFPFHRELFEAIVARDLALAREKTYAILAIVEEDIRDMSR